MNVSSSVSQAAGHRSPFKGFTFEIISKTKIDKDEDIFVDI